MQTRTVLDHYPMPPCARLLGWRMVDADPEAGRVRVAFDALPDFCNAGGTVQGGFIAAMLDDAMGPAMLIGSGGAVYPATIEMKVSFLAPVRPGTLTAEARVVRRGGTIGFLEARLYDGEGGLVATATASARMIPAGKAVGQAR